MPDANSTPTSFAQRLNRLFETVHPPGRGPLSPAEVSRACSNLGVPVSPPYISQLRNGARVVPSTRIREAIARAFGVSSTYFTDDAYFERIDADLMLLAASKTGPVRRLVDAISILPPAARVELEIFIGTFADDEVDRPRSRDSDLLNKSVNYQVGISQLRADVLHYVKLSASGHIIDVTRRGAVLARMQPLWMSRPQAPSGSVIIVRITDLRSRTAYYMDRIMDGAGVYVVHQDRPVVWIGSVNASTH
ncbi:helix-turn-helix domain-containing protein [Mycobacterium sp. PDNC021]|uniref:helix-turn-helix domain-containing protein n=1 Tax=Mycobacterium sp. PDNC021 TaxID=3391399 RepID=UPI003AACA87B